jgi:hypothetical protein
MVIFKPLTRIVTGTPLVIVIGTLPGDGGR